MKKFTINCDFGGQMAPFTIYIGTPKEGNHPLENQAKWLSDNRGGVIPGEVMEAIGKLQELSKKNKVSLEELCVYALGTEEEQAEMAAKQGIEQVAASDEAIVADNEGDSSDFSSDEEQLEGASEEMIEEGAPIEGDDLKEDENKDVKGKVKKGKK